ncbi:unnamed protein product, partial [Prorocentrum cordatum]
MSRLPHAHRAADAACADLRRLAGERRADWAALARGEDAPGALPPEEAAVREAWRAWREDGLLAELQQPELRDGNQVLLRSVAGDLQAAYESACAQFGFGADEAGAPESATGAAVSRLSKISRAARLETQRGLRAAACAGWAEAASGEPEPPARPLPCWASPAALALGASGLGPGTAWMQAELRWSQWYAAAESRLGRAALAKQRLLQMRRLRAARAIQRIFAGTRQRREQAATHQREAAARVVQRAFQQRLAPRLARARLVLRALRERMLLWRLRRRLCRHALCWRCARWAIAAAHPPAVAASAAGAAGGPAALRIQRWLRGHWSRSGWAYCWAPPFQRPQTLAGRAHERPEELPPLTAAQGAGFARLRARRRGRALAARRRGTWAAAAGPERLLLRSWLREEEARRQRSAHEALVSRRFEAQWSRYAEGLEAHVRAHVEGERWMVTSDPAGQRVWMSVKTGKTRRGGNPAEARVRENLARERRRAEERPAAHLAALRASWADEDAAGRALHAAGLLELASAARGAWE